MKWSFVALAMITTSVSLAIPALPAFSQSPKVINSIAYQCADQKGFSALVFEDKSMEATFGSKVLVLKQAEAASGARYTDGSVTVYTKGDESFVEVGSKKVFVDCVAVSAPVQGMW
jgi:membrane-bound inhibitor of C-type lysozyme